MQDLKALEGKSLAELREIAKALGIKNVMIKKRLYFPERQGEEHCPGPKYLLMAIAGPGILRDLCPENNETGIFGHCIVCIVNVCV